MAKMIPHKPLSTAPVAVHALFRLLRKLDDSFTVWTRLQHDDGPSFLVLWRSRHAFLIKVAATSQALAETALQPSFLPGETISTDQLGDDSPFRAALDGHEEPAVRRLVVFPNVDAGTIDEIERLRSESTGVAFLGLKQRHPADFQRHLEALSAGEVSVPALYRLRARFTPESVIAPPPVRSPLARRSEDATLPLHFLDLSQESLAKLEVELPRELEREARSFETRLVTGPAGCGKSLVLLHRALLVAKLNRQARVLVLTHNRPINAELERRLHHTAGSRLPIEWRTFFAWAHQQSPHRPHRILAPREVEKRLEQFSSPSPLGRLTPHFLCEEIGYLRDLGIDSLAEYQALERSGRGIALTAPVRAQIWNLLEQHRSRMNQLGESDWHEQALRFRDHIRSHPGILPRYDFIFIDEAQFFAKVWFEPVLAALKPGGQLFLAADPTQGFLKRRDSWAAAGIDVRGRSSRLSRPYRSSREILRFARQILEQRRPLHPEYSADLDPPGDDEIASAESTGESPQILPLSSSQALLHVVREIETLRRDSPHLAGNILLLHADSLAARTLLETLRHKLGHDAVDNLDARSAEPRPAAPFCSVSRLSSATGLEAAIVFLLGIDTLLARESDPRLDPDTRAELASDHTRLLYMAATRAARRLILYSPIPIP